MNARKKHTFYRKPHLKKKREESIRNAVETLNQVENNISNKYKTIINNISFNPKCPSCVVGKHYLHFKFDYNMFFTLCFENEPDCVSNYLTRSYMMKFATEFYCAKTFDEKSYILSDVHDFLLSIQDVTGLIQTVFNPSNINDFSISFSDRLKYIKSIQVH